MKDHIRLLFAGFFAALALTAGGATIGEQTMVNLTLGDGLSGETVNHVMTDHRGYVWIATTGGLSIYNGRNLMTMRIADEKGLPLAVNTLCETSGGDIYAATTKGLYRLTYKAGRFERVLPEVEQPLALLAVGDTLYIGSEQGLMVYDGRRLTQHDVGVARKGLDNIVRHYVRGADGTVWLLGRHDLNRYDPRTKHIEHFGFDRLLGCRYVLSQFVIVDGKAWIGTRDGGMFVCDLQSRDIHHVEAVGKIVVSVQHSRDGLVAVATDGTGGYLIDPATERVVEHFTTEATGMRRLPTNALYSFYRDDRGVNWFGTVRHGLVYNPYSSGLFKPYACDGLSTLGMNVRSFMVRGSQMVIGQQDGLWLVDGDRHVRRHFTADETGGHFVNNIVWWQGCYVIGQYEGGVRLLHPESATLTRQPWSDLLDDTTVGDIAVAPDSSLWIGCADGLFIVRRDGTVRQLTEQNSRIIGSIIIDITFDGEGNAWLTGAKGLCIYSHVSHDVIDANFPKGFFHREAYMRGLLGHDGTIYMRNGPSLYYTTNRMEHYGEVPMPVTLTDRWCRAMADDMAGWLWIASERGLLGFDYEGRGLIQLGEGEGLLGSQINELRMDGSERLWVATSQGLFTTTRQDLTAWLKQPRSTVTLYHVRVGSDLLSAAGMSDVSEQHHIRLTWNLTSQALQAEPLLLDYARQQGRFYEYSVDGGEWVLTDGSQPVDVRHLLLGTHRLAVRMAGVEGTTTTYQLSVVPSSAAYAELVLLLLAAALLWWWWRYRKFTKRVISEHHQTEDALIAESQLLREKGEALAAALDHDGEPETGREKYQRMKMSDKECSDIVKQMRRFLETEHAYRNPELKRTDIAEAIGVSAVKLSQVFTLYLKESYYDFINRYRLDEFKRLVEAGECQKYTVTAISERCGFKKSSFFTTFRKVEGMTPTEYLSRKNIKTS